MNATKKYNDSTYQKTGFVIVPDYKYYGYKVLQTKDNFYSYTTFNSKQSAQNFIDDVIDIFIKYNLLTD